MINNVFGKDGKRISMFETEIPGVVIDKGTKIICIIGSMKFYDIMLSEAAEIHKLGHIVLLPFKDTSDMPSKDQLKIFDTTIREMIKMSDIVYVINKDGYIGESVKGEINYATSLEKKIVYYSSSIEAKIITLCGSFRYKKQFKYIKTILDTSLNGDYKYRFLTYLPEFIDTPNFHEYMTDDQLKEVHTIFGKKIQSSDLLIVIDTSIDINLVCSGISNFAKDVHVGEDTQREINFADSWKIPIIYLSRVFLTMGLSESPDVDIINGIINFIDNPRDIDTLNNMPSECE